MNDLDVILSLINVEIDKNNIKLENGHENNYGKGENTYVEMWKMRT